MFAVDVAQCYFTALDHSYELNYMLSAVSAPGEAEVMGGFWAHTHTQCIVRITLVSSFLSLLNAGVTNMHY